MFSYNLKSLGFFSSESLSKKENKVTFTKNPQIINNKLTREVIKEEEANNKRLTRYSNIANDAKNLLLQTLHCLWNPSLIVPFFSGPIYSNLPHVRAQNPFGHLQFNEQNAEEFTKEAQKTPNGIATFWAGPFPVLYVVSNDARLALVQESHVGIVDDTSSKYLNWMSGGNKVMSTFPDFRPVDSQTYLRQRKFLIRLFHGGAKERLPDIEKATTNFLQHYCEEQGECPRPLKELLTAMVMHASSHLLGLTQVPLDSFYCTKPEYARVIDRVAHYGISERSDLEFEELLYKLFLQVLQSNFDQILSETEDTNLIRNIFASMDVQFPQVFEDFNEIPKDKQHDIAMNFVATGFGAMIHSTANTLDWAVARLLNDPHKLEELTKLMAKHKNLDLTQENIFDKGGLLFPLSEWVLHNVFLYPPFSHEFFINQKPFLATLADRSTIKVHSGSFILVNYVQCNRSNEQMNSLHNFSKSLKENSIIGRFISDQQVASFGGSIISKKNSKSRICPGAKTSLYEQMVMLAILLRDYSLKLTDAKDLSCDVDPNKHPLCARLNSGYVVLNKSAQFADDNKKVMQLKRF